MKRSRLGNAGRVAAFARVMLMCLLAEGSHDIVTRELGAKTEKVAMFAETGADSLVAHLRPFAQRCAAARSTSQLSLCSHTFSCDDDRIPDANVLVAHDGSILGERQF